MSPRHAHHPAPTAARLRRAAPIVEIVGCLAIVGLGSILLWHADGFALNLWLGATMVACGVGGACGGIARLWRLPPGGSAQRRGR